MSKRFRKIKRVFKERCNINLSNHEVRQYLHALERRERYRRRYLFQWRASSLNYYINTDADAGCWWGLKSE